MINLQDKIKEYDELFPFLVNINDKHKESQVKQFWIDYIKEEMEGLIPEEKDTFDGSIIEDNVGYNECVDELIERVNKIIK